MQISHLQYVIHSIEYNARGCHADKRRHQSLIQREESFSLDHVAGNTNDPTESFTSRSNHLCPDLKPTAQIR
ncbi:hypothetical protein ZEAMMB73_Zm00001d024682 [Zea mays]|uniref:Uncharacterized protein n=1 Tax=Zea mays TaxID=4577 RepID=A0A1D6J111_MAIZE|nr:hypothetical protein ZEAMMB73_Zm00001d024682 [Zea mays]